MKKGITRTVHRVSRRLLVARRGMAILQPARWAEEENKREKVEEEEATSEANVSVWLL